MTLKLLLISTSQITPPTIGSRSQAGQTFALKREDSAPRAAVRGLTPELEEPSIYTRPIPLGIDQMSNANSLGNRLDDQCTLREHR